MLNPKNDKMATIEISGPNSRGSPSSLKLKN